MSEPTLVVVSGPAGTGKTTLAHKLGHAIGCPVISRDEIKEGMLHSVGHFEAAPGDTLTMRTLPLFFSALRLLLEGGVTVVAEAAFQDEVWRPNLESLTGLARLRIVQCHTEPLIARERVRSRGGPRRAHADGLVLESDHYFDDFRRVTIPAPTIDVDTTSGYEPPLERIVEFSVGA